MAIPDYEQIMAPLLKLLSDQKPRKVSELLKPLADHFDLTEEDRNELLPSGTQRRWRNRTNWACYHLYRAGLLERPKRGVYAITKEGLKVEKMNPGKIDRGFLMQFPDFADFVQKRSPQSDESSQSESTLVEQSKTPQEAMEAAFASINSELKDELLERVKGMDPYGFERYSEYSGQKRIWTTSSEAIAETGHDVSVYRSWPEKDYRIIGSLQFEDRNQYWNDDIIAKAADEAEDRGGDAIIIRRGSEFGVSKIIGAEDSNSVYWRDQTTALVIQWLPEEEVQRLVKRK